MDEYQIKLLPKNKKIVSLYNSLGVHLIFKINSGVIYTNQTGGHACCQSFEEGVLLPFNSEYVHKESIIEKELSSITNNNIFLSPEIADKIDKIFMKYSVTKCAKVDRIKLKESMEAWVHVIISENKECEFYNFYDGKGILTWNNSD
ncbi:MAG: hypothetical protein HOE80_00850 [Candidatus Magasanikbacteria bacterium]|jgi:hypothetical protein|nr:hypothetical protein [Candidatus Magasanikbacteria bacterium]MBT4071254.1 hypothetical protein [Candidatus Magasanikbacteria bacterium]